MKFTKGTKVCTSAEGKRYYFDHRRDIEGVVVEHNGNVVTVKYGPGQTQAIQMYDNCVEAVAPSEDEVAEAIQSIHNTPRRGT